MVAYIKKNVHLQILIASIILPLMIWSVSNEPQRTLLKESLSIVTLVAFSLMISLFYLSRTNQSVVNKMKFSTLIGLHKFIGYTAVTLLLLHPVTLVIPRFFEAGIAPFEAFTTIVTTFTSQGVVLGLLAWSLMLLIGVTSLCRKQLPIRYQTWRVFHAVLASLSALCATFHVFYLGRHSGFPMIIFITLLTTGGLYLLLNSYTSKDQKTGEKV
ncbi:ferric reductase-like transmembrane domain-containing protein [Desulfuromusa kysingii]|nr:ferric reductase-like transmembrane domain-containing protein [Desulfuromusa kysingii]